jgi:hypothetical protein
VLLHTGRVFLPQANDGTTMTDLDNRDPGGEIPPGDSTEMQSDKMTRWAEFWLLSLAAVMFIVWLAILIKGFL